ncbi:hypothetical protein GZ77_19530 [Endozoicomonas montiporae]|uniref:Uncharacterized protein n=2 Tax=Endozoicomonas montiporae TaxID=1027273 RepID=A0A081N2K6_9GAMM|nr:tetratricopeptide repeat protein [Endozoicomonas montiporae]AMO54805.1 hypothetical protein EZMO1_0558 [Endozoicomonas montiporae CL-33]KEQ12679.1 hypothetical protein GZ77_19530 [Endozoicomonas montiporae]
MNVYKKRPFRSPVILVLLSVILTGCGGRLSYLPSEPVEAGSPYESRDDAVGVLLNQAYQAIEGGLLDEAVGWLSRAMRINPVEPAIYYHMAEIRIEQGDSDQARQLLGRALSLGPDQRMTQKLETLLSSLES